MGRGLGTGRGLGEAGDEDGAGSGRPSTWTAWARGGDGLGGDGEVEQPDGVDELGVVGGWG